MKKVNKKLRRKTALKHFLKENKDVFNIICVGVLAWLSAVMFNPKEGFVSSFPLILIFALLSSFISLRISYKALIFFIFGITMRLLATEDFTHSIYFGIVCALFCIFSSASISLFKSKNKKALCRVSALILLAAMIVSHVYFNDLPNKSYIARNIINDYISENYADENMKVETPFYRHGSGQYSVQVSYDGAPTEKVLITFDKAVGIDDEYVDFSAHFIMRSEVSALKTVLRDNFPDDGFGVISGGIVNYPRGNKITCTAEMDGYKNYAEYIIMITDALTVTEFTKRASLYLDTLLESSFKCRSLVFYGGERGKYYAKIDVPFFSAHAPLASLVTDAEKK